MRVVVWNVANKQRAFEALGSLEPDIALLNEAAPPPTARGIWRDETAGRDAKRRKWSTAVLTPHSFPEITDAQPQWRTSKRNVPFECSRPGSWVAAAVEVAAGETVTAVALYGLLDELSDSSKHRSLSEISPVLDDRRYRRHVLIGGDFNTGTAWPAGDYFQPRDVNVLGRFEALGLVDCLVAMRPTGRLEGCTCVFGDECTHTRTRLDPRRPHVPYQTDYLWASRQLAKRLRSCEALATDEWFANSDHAPILAEFDL